MLIIYRILINIIFVISPIIIIFRLIKKKESFQRFKEKYCFFSKKRNFGKVSVVSGINEGDLVITEGVSKVRNNAKIKIINPRN